MDQLLERFFVHLQESDFSPETIRNYQQDLKKFLSWYQDTEGERPTIKTIGSLDIADFRRYLQNKSQKPATINRALSTLNSFFNWAVQNNHISSNPASGVKKVAEDKRAPVALTRNEQRALSRAVNESGNPRDKAIIELFLHTGLRASELCSLEIDDLVINERSGTVTIRQGKGNKYREVSLNVTVRKSLLEWLQARKGNGKAVFLNRYGRKISTRAVGNLIDKYAYMAKLTGVTPHTLRHTFCKSLTDAGVSLDRVALLAGHKSLDTTARYTMPTKADLQKAVDQLSWE